MAVSLPYLVSYKNLPALFEKISTAKVPEAGFTHNFLQTTIGLKGTNDRALIPLLRNLGFLDQSNNPTPAYRVLKGDKRKVALAAGIRKAYRALFDADQNANKLTGDKIKGLVAQIAGTDSDLTNRIANTFLQLVSLADFESDNAAEDGKTPESNDTEDTEPQHEHESVRGKVKGLRTEFHYNIQVQLPSNGTEETYLNIFNAIRKTFQ